MISLKNYLNGERFSSDNYINKSFNDEYFIDE